MPRNTMREELLHSNEVKIHSNQSNDCYVIFGPRVIALRRIIAFLIVNKNGDTIGLFRPKKTLTIDITQYT